MRRHFFGGLDTQQGDPDKELAVLDAIEAGLPEEDVLDAVGALETLGVVGGSLVGAWELLFTSTSKFDVGAPLGRRVDGTAPGLEGVFTALSGGAEASSEGGRRASSSPLQRLFTGAFRAEQVITSERVDTVVNMTGVGTVTLVADLEPSPSKTRLNFLFSEGYFIIGGLRLPYPVPFRLLGDEARGWIETTYCSQRLRVSRGNKGTVFVLRRGR